MKCKHEIEVDKFGDRTCKHCWLRESTIKAEAKEKQCECLFCQGLMSPGVQPGKDCLKYGAPEHMKMYEEIKKISSSYKYHDENNCATMRFPSVTLCSHTGCVGLYCNQKVEEVKQCDCGGQEEYEEFVEEIKQLFTSLLSEIIGPEELRDPSDNRTVRIEKVAVSNYRSEIRNRAKEIYLDLKER